MHIRLSDSCKSNTTPWKALLSPVHHPQAGLHWLSRSIIATFLFLSFLFLLLFLFYHLPLPAHRRHCLHTPPPRLAPSPQSRDWAACNSICPRSEPLLYRTKAASKAQVGERLGGRGAQAKQLPARNKEMQNKNREPNICYGLQQKRDRIKAYSNTERARECGKRYLYSTYVTSKAEYSNSVSTRPPAHEA
ncbi:hypothetical protein BGZ63DRAFT_372690 [Mariannaea sp. PMI_226]|nr:hypothetical protein BGZ63DRAFT_372690 [Mariannaea sp. PMI_226]